MSTSEPVGVRSVIPAITDESGCSHHKAVSWCSTLFGLQPQWLVEPDVEIVAKLVHRQLSMSTFEIEKCHVFKLAEGAFNKTFAVEYPNGSLIMRIALPVDPGYKTLSEVATLEVIRKHTNIQVPKVIGFDSTSTNPLGYEWILQERVNGETLEARWDSLSWKAKVEIVHDVVGEIVKLVQFRHELIGNMYLTTNSRKEQDFIVGRIVSMPFFWNQRLIHGKSLGPFKSSKDWFEARLLLIEHECKVIVDKQQDEDTVEDAEITLDIIDKLRCYMTKLFQSNDLITSLFHHDLSSYNIIVDENGSLSGLIDWECVGFVPLWCCCQYPTFLEGPDRYDKPIQETYDLLNGSQLYAEHLRYYELTVLRKVFLKRMEIVNPQWVDIFRSSGREIDFELAVTHCDNSLMLKRIQKWLSTVEKDVYQRLEVY